MLDKTHPSVDTRGAHGSNAPPKFPKTNLLLLFKINDKNCVIMF